MGGMLSSGGAPSAGGTVATGGAPTTSGGSNASGGQSTASGGSSSGGAASGGASGGAGQGGRVSGGAGGASASTGGRSSGGSSSSGGQASTGSGGAASGGSTGTSAACKMIQATYAAELEKQLGCNPRGASQCMGHGVAAAGCSCQVFIQPTDPFAIENLSNFDNDWYVADCTMPTCPARCTTATAGTCQADTRYSLGGRCVTP